MIRTETHTLTYEERTRWLLTRIAYNLVRSGLPASLIMQDALDGCDLATTKPEKETR